MSAAEERQKRMEAARANAATYLYDRSVNSVPVRALAKRAGISEKDMLEVLKGRGYTYKQAREDDRLSLVNPHGSRHSPGRRPGSREPTWESMLAGVGADHD